MSKTSDLPLPPQTMLNFSKMDGNKKVVGSTFLGAGGGGRSGMNSKPFKKLSLGVLCNNITCKGFSTVSQVLFTSIGDTTTHTHTQTRVVGDYLKGVFCGSISALYLINARPPLGNPPWLTGNCEMKSGSGP